MTPQQPSFGTSGVVDPTSGAMQAIAQARAGLSDIIKTYAADEEMQQRKEMADKELAQRKELTTMELAQRRDIADKTYALAKTADERAADKAAREKSLYLANALDTTLPMGQDVTTQVQVPGQISSDTQSRIAALEAEKQRLLTPAEKEAAAQGSVAPEKSAIGGRTLSEINIAPENTAKSNIVVPGTFDRPAEMESSYNALDTTSTIPTGYEANGIKLAEPITKKELPKTSTQPDLSFLNKTSTTDPIAAEVTKSTTKTALPTPAEIKKAPEKSIQAIQAEINKLRSVPTQTVQKQVTKLAKLDPNDINKRLTEQYRTVYGKEPSEYDKAAIGARTKEVYQRMYNEQKDQRKYELDKAKADSSMRYMETMINAANRPKASGNAGVSGKNYLEYQKMQSKHNEGWDKNITALNKLDVGGSDIVRSSKYLQMMRTLGLAPELGNAVLNNPQVTATGVTNWDRGITPEAITEATGLQVTSNGKLLGLGEAMDIALENNWNLTYNPTSRQIELLQPIAK